MGGYIPTSHTEFAIREPLAQPLILGRSDPHCITAVSTTQSSWKLYRRGIMEKRWNSSALQKPSAKNVRRFPAALKFKSGEPD